MSSTPPGPRNLNDCAQRDAVIVALGRPWLIRDLHPQAARCVSALRILALCSRHRRDPLLELIVRMRSVEAAQAYLCFADKVGATWPDHLLIFRPCCQQLSADEWTIGAIAEAAAIADRAGFSDKLDGFVRRDRHDDLFRLAVEAMATL